MVVSITWVRTSVFTICILNKDVARGGGVAAPPLACHRPLRGEGGKDPKLTKKRGKHEKNEIKKVLN